MSFYNSFEEIFQEMKKRLTLTPTAMKLWIEPLKPLKLNNNHVMLYVESQFSKDMTMANFKTVMEEAFSDLLGFDVEVEILCSEDLTVEQKLKYYSARIHEAENSALKCRWNGRTLSSSEYCLMHPSST